MKKHLIILAVSFIIFSGASAQIVASEIGIRDELKSISQFATKTQTGYETIQTYSSNEIKGSQFFYPTWVSGSITTVNKEIISDNYLFVFDRVRQQLFIKQKNSDTVLIADKSQIISFTLNTDKKHVFVPDVQFNKSAKDISFYEVMEQNENGYSFFKFENTRLVKVDPNDMVRVKNGDMSDEFVNTTVYYLYSTSTFLNKITFNEKNILKALDVSKQELAKTFFAEHKSDKIDEKFVIELLYRLNKVV